MCCVFNENFPVHNRRPDMPSGKPSGHHTKSYFNKFSDEITLKMLVCLALFLITKLIRV